MAIRRRATSDDRNGSPAHDSLRQMSSPPGEVTAKDHRNEPAPGHETKRSELEAERDLERQFRAIVQSQATNRIQPDGPRNGSFTGTRLVPPKPSPLPKLYGRVAFCDPDPDDGSTDFYIANAYARIGDINIYNWTTPFAGLFFDCHRPREVLPGNVTAVRTFEYNAGSIVDFVDDILDHTAPRPIFVHHSPSDYATEAESSDVQFSAPPEQEPTSTKSNPALVGQAAAQHVPAIPFVRASQLLRAQMDAPRATKLQPVLTTLQPDQYRLVAAPPEASIVVEGGPGTGKSIIASHRAAFLVDPDPSTVKPLTGELLVIGPTTDYLEYIGGVIEELTDGSPRIRMASLDGLKKWDLPKTNSASESLPVETAPLRHAIETASARLRNGHDTVLTVAQVYEYLRRNSQYRRPLTVDRRTIELLNRLPPYRDAASSGSTYAVRSQIEQYLTNNAIGSSESRLRPDPVSLHFDHIIVDEAQDVTLAEWSILKALNRGGAWTILGDFNQRRADKTPRDWASVLSAVGLSHTTPQYALERGYRSTMPILEYASKLLPNGARPPAALRCDGPKPVFDNPIREHLVSVVIRHIDQLLTRHPDGTIAVISTMPGSVQAKLGHEERWQNVKVLGPNHARGLEFDAVVVVEPADFPRNDHRRQGLLYTALTRANKELVIVHSKPLPLQLQEQQDRGSTAGPKPIQVRRPATAALSPKAQRKSKRRRKRARRKFNSMH